MLQERKDQLDLMSSPTLSNDSSQSDESLAETHDVPPGRHDIPTVPDGGPPSESANRSGGSTKPVDQPISSVPVQGFRTYRNSKPRSKTELNKAKFLRDHDLGLKLEVGAALASSGYFTRINVAMSATGDGGLADVTDIDVLGLRHDETFRSEAMAVSCKSGKVKSLSPAKEVFYLRGVLDYVGAGVGVVAFLNRPMAPHLRDLGRQLNVLVLSGSEIAAWCNSLRNGIPDAGYFDLKSLEKYLAIWTNPANVELLTYLRTDYWFHRDFRNLQNVIAHVRKLISKRGDRYNLFDLVLLETAAHLCITVFDLCHEIRMMGLPAIVETTNSYLFGGAVSFKARRDLYVRVEQLLASTGVLRKDGPALPPLEPAYTKSLSEIAIRFLERPHAAVLIPQILQDRVWQRLGAVGMPPRDDKNFLAGEKLAQDLVDFLLTTAGGKSRVII